MADNYLEKKMEEHRRGALSRTNKCILYTKNAQRGNLIEKFKKLRILISDGDANCASAIIRRFVSAGCDVAFMSSNIKAGRLLSQTTSSRFYPVVGTMSLEDVFRDLFLHWNGIDVFIITDSLAFLKADAIIVPDECKRVISIAEKAVLPKIDSTCESVIVNAISTQGITFDDVANFALYLCLPSLSFIDKKCFDFSKE